MNTKNMLVYLIYLKNRGKKKLNITEALVCPRCNNKKFSLKHESTYVYTYKLNTPEMQNFSKETEFLPFLFDNREHTNLKQYFCCETCGAEFPCSFNVEDEKINLTIVQKAIRSDHIKEPEFWG